MTHVRATIQNSRPARVTGAISATVDVDGSSIEDNGVVRYITAVRLGPALRNSSSACIVKGFAITRGGKVIIFPVTGWYGGIIEASNEQRGHVLIFTLTVQVAPVRQTNDRCYRSEQRCRQGVLSQFPGKHASV